MGSYNVRAEQIDERIRGLGHRARWVLAGKQDGLGGDELLPLWASGSVDPAGEAREAVRRVDGRLTGSGRRRRRRGRTDLEQGDDPVRPGADAGVPDLGEHTGLEVLEEWLGPVRERPGMRTSPPVHGAEM